MTLEVQLAWNQRHFSTSACCRQCWSTWGWRRPSKRHSPHLPVERAVMLSCDFHKDLNWFNAFLPQTSSMFTINDKHREPISLYVDTCTTGCGAICHKLSMPSFRSTSSTKATSYAILRHVMWLWQLRHGTRSTNESSFIFSAVV